MLTAWRETPDVYDETARAALRWAECVTLVAQTSVPDGEFEAASTSFTPQQIVDLTLAVALINAYNLMAISFRRTPEHLAELWAMQSIRIEHNASVPSSAERPARIHLPTVLLLPPRCERAPRRETAQDAG